MIRPWPSVPPLVADLARSGVEHFTTRELRQWNAPPPAELRCWRTTAEGRHWQGELTKALNPTPNPETPR